MLKAMFGVKDPLFYNSQRAHKTRAIHLATQLELPRFQIPVNVFWSHPRLRVIRR